MDKNQRTAIYKLLSMGMSYPEKEIAQAIDSGWLFFQCKEYLKDDKDSLAIIDEIEKEYTDIEDLQVNYTTNFDLKISLYESHYVLKDSKPEERGKFLFELEKFYINAGVELSDMDMPDYLPTELEFMHYLCAENLLDKQKIFIQNHLLNWVPQLLKKTEKHNIKFYSPLIKLIDNFVKKDFAYLKNLTF